MLAPKESQSIVVNARDLASKEKYTFFCSFADHSFVMNGELVKRE